jgi:uncharacterized protein YdhG (YjbR/CyaY superfamily)
MQRTAIKDVDEYIASFPQKIQRLLKQLRKTIKSAAPDAEESISYQMPAYKYPGRPLVYFAGYENHIGLYATPSANIIFKKELTSYKTGKGSIQFPIDKPLPLALITKIVKYRLGENIKKEAAKPKKTKKTKPKR